jgi:endoglucanase
MRTFRAGLGVCLLLFAHVQAQTPRPLSAVPRSRGAHLQRGINLSEWFAQVYDRKGYTKEHFDSWTSAGDIALIKSLGFDHVRLSVNPQPMFTANHPNDLPPEYLAYLDAAVKMILNQGLAVILDLHPESDFKARLNQDAFVQQFADFWQALAHHYRNWDRELLFFEILNEPEMVDRYRWYGVQTKLVAAAREGAPEHTILATGAHWSSQDELVFLEPLREPNLIYTFHFYSPHLFTHQGATWSSYFWHWVKGVRYPSTPESANQAAQSVPDAMDRLSVIRYGYDHWDADRIDSEISQVAAWAAQNNLPVLCDEFGVYRVYADPEDRVRWIRDVRRSLEQHRMGWTLWDYSGAFGLVTKTEGRAVADPAVVDALGLKLPPGSR